MKEMQKPKMLQAGGRYSERLTLPPIPLGGDGTPDRDRMRETLLREEYGFVDDSGVTVTYQTVKTEEKQICGKCTAVTLEFSVQRGEKSAQFPCRVFLPKACPGARTVLYLSFAAEAPSKYVPIEELMDMGLTFAHLCYKEVSSDDGDFADGVAALLGDRNRPGAAGKLAIWAWAASRCADALFALGYAKEGGLCVAGHSRLGKTALLAGALDERFLYVHSNCSGCGGAAVFREKTGETAARIAMRFPYWFCPEFGQYGDREEELPFDQHWLLGLCAPRHLSVVAAEEDTWADTDAQYLCAEAASGAYEALGVWGLDEPDGVLPMPGETFGGRIAFKKRLGTHFFSREDWQFLNRFFRI